MEVITPRTLEEALRIKSERPDARPIAGGTDLLVELNFDRTRPETILNLAEVPELKGWARENGSVRLAAGLTYTEAMQPELAELLPALAEASRTVGSPQIRNRGTIGGNLGTASPAGDAHPPLLVEDATVEIGSTRGVRTLPLTEFFLGPKRNALAEDELVLAVRVDPSRRAADLHEGGAAQRDGDRGLLARRRGRPRARRAARGLRIGRPGARTRDGAARCARRLSRCSSPPHRARSTTSAARPPTAATR